VGISGVLVGCGDVGVTVTVGVHVGGKTRGVAVAVGRTNAAGMVGGGKGFTELAGFRKMVTTKAITPTIASSAMIDNKFHITSVLRERGSPAS
jgi:hypothetical protein